ncbi:hypothetical protein [Shiella aurantiaca]|uniref:hypothetical protein n=1 Tax=Shiella aurantiaca TaxID=3058365 RepID=UPI0029F4C444|nr:hypothetical protein [Shiella aurantiaca]
MTVTWEEFLFHKKIHAEAFQKQEPQLYAQWKHDYEHMHPESFVSRHLFQINGIRRKYPLAAKTSHS